MAAMTAAQGERERIANLSREALADLALTIARRVIGEHLQADPALVQRIVADTIAELEPSYSVHVHVNPADLDIVEANREELDRMISDGVIHLKADPTVDRGGCVLISPAGDVDARIATKLSVLETAFAAQRRHVEGGGA
jgi:type III secretion protein L